MTDGKLLIEKLLIYAKDKLELSEYDVSVKRNLLLHLFGLTETDVPTVTEEVTFDTLETELLSFAKENPCVGEDEELAFTRFIFGVLLPLPSFINKKFRTLREKFGAHAACEYLYGLSVNSGAFSNFDFNAKTEKFHSQDGGDFYVRKHRIPTPVKAKTGNYPKCDLCAFAEGFYGKNQLNGGALRSVSLDLNGNEWKMRFTEPVSKLYEGVVSYRGHGVKSSVVDTLTAMLDFIEYLPEYSCDAAIEDAAFTTEESHANFSTGVTDSPLFNQKPSFTATSEIYPDVEISVYNRDISAMRLQSFNRNTLERLAIEVLEKWQDYSDQSESVYGRGADGISLNDAFVSVSYSKDNRYSVEIVFTGKKTDNFSVTGNVSTFDYALDRSAFFGRFILNEDVIAAKDAMVTALTKKTPVGDELFQEGEVLYGYDEILRKIISEVGYVKDYQKAETLVKQEIANAVFASLRKKSAFSAGDDGVRSLRRFLSTLSIR